MPNGYNINFTFHFFQLEPGHYSPCYYSGPVARVTITNVTTNNNDDPFMLCGQSVPLPVYSVGNFIQVIFTSLRNQYSGFNGTYKAIEGTNDVNPISNIHYFSNNTLRYLCNLLLLAFSLSPGGFLVTVVFSGLSKSSSFKFT